VRAPWLLTGLWTAGLWSLVWLGLVAADGLTGGGIVGPGLALGLFSAVAALATVILRPWDGHGKAATVVAPPGPFPRLGGLKGNREVAVGLGVVAVILAGATVAGDGPLHGPTVLGLWGVLVGCGCLYGLLALRPPGRVPFAWVPVAPAAAPEEPVRRDVESLLGDLSASGSHRGRMAWHLTLPASEALFASDRRVHSCLGPAMPGLYLHQARAWDLLAEGENVLMAAPLGAGKSTLAALYAVERVLGSGRTVLSVCPDPDAARRTGGAFARVLHEAEVDWAIEVETLATVDDARRYLEEPSRPVPDVAVVTAEVLHEAVLPRGQRWEPLLRNTGLVVVEDIHLYDPVARQHAACTLRRLWRALDRLEVTPQVLVTSADSADPRRFARDLTGLDLKARAVITTDARSRPALHVVYWQPEAAGGGEGGSGGARSSSGDRVPGLGAGHPLGVTPHPVCDLMARAVLSGFAVALVTHPDWLSPALAGAVEAEALRLGRELAREGYLRERDRLAAQIEATFGEFMQELDDGLLEAERSLREGEEPDEHVIRDLVRTARDMAAVLRSVARETVALLGGPPLRDHGDAERRLRALAALRERLRTLGGLPPRLEALATLKERLAALLSSTAVEGLATALRVFADKMAGLEKARIQVCATLEASPSPTGPTYAGPDGPDRPLSAAEAFDFVVIMGAPAPHFIIAHQLAHLGQGRTRAPSDALVVLVPTAEPVSRWLERHPGALVEAGSELAFPAALGDRHVLPLHLGCALSEAGVTSTELAEAEAQRAFGEDGLAALDELGTSPLTSPGDGRPDHQPAAPRRLGGPAISFAVADPPGTVFTDPLRPGREVTRLDHPTAVVKAYPGAILSAAGERYRVREDTGRGLRLEETTDITLPILEVSLTPAQAQPWSVHLGGTEPLGVAVDRGPVRLKTVGFTEYAGPDLTCLVRRVDLGDRAPEATLSTDRLHLTLPPGGDPSLLAGLVEGALSLCVQAAADTLRVTPTPTGLVIWDLCPGGTGAVALAADALPRILRLSLRRLLECRCLNGCAYCLGRAVAAEKPGPAVRGEEETAFPPGAKRELIGLLTRLLGLEPEDEDLLAVRYGSLGAAGDPDAVARRLLREVADVLTARLGLHLGPSPEVRVARGKAAPDTGAESGEAHILELPAGLNEGEALAFVAYSLALRAAERPEGDEAEAFAAGTARRVRAMLRLDHRPGMSKINVGAERNLEG